MRALALFGGAAAVVAIGLWHSPPTRQGIADGERFSCTGDATSFCGALSGLAEAIHDPILTGNRANILPPPETPGATDPTVAQANIDTTICRPGYARAARPAYAVTGPLKRRMMNAHHPGEAMADYELDHLIPISIGGAPLDARDLWLQPRKGPANAADKNVLAYVLWRLVCTHQVPLSVAQHDISHDWTKAYQTYATPENVAKYHFRHAEQERD